MIWSQLDIAFSKIYTCLKNIQYCSGDHDQYCNTISDTQSCSFSRSIDQLMKRKLTTSYFHNQLIFCFGSIFFIVQICCFSVKDKDYTVLDSLRAMSVAAPTADASRSALCLSWSEWRGIKIFTDLLKQLVSCYEKLLLEVFFCLSWLTLSKPFYCCWPKLSRWLFCD